MPFDKNGKYYRKPVYRVEKMRKGLPLLQELPTKTLGMIYTSIAISVLVVGLLKAPIQNYIENIDSIPLIIFIKNILKNK